MTWSGYRPSDDVCEFGYLIPSNMFAVTILKQLVELFDKEVKTTNCAIRLKFF